MRRFLWTAVLFPFFLTGCDLLDSSGPTTPAPKRPPRVHGGGSSFVNHLMTKWCTEYPKGKEVKVHYQSLGSGAGVQYMTLRTFDFGATDAPMSDEELRKAKEIGGDVVHIPVCMGAVVAAYNMPEVSSPLQFTPQVLADIFLGKIKKWNHPDLVAINPDAKLPDQDIAVVHRSDSSGTTAIFTDYLNKVNPEWAKKVGAGKTVTWPCGVGQKGNEGLAAYLTKTPGAIGYTELNFAMENDKTIKTGFLQNREGQFVRPLPQTVTKTAFGAMSEIREDLRFSLVDPPGKDAYPICGTTWIVLYVDQQGEKGQALVDFARWALHEGQNDCEALRYARVPDALVEKADKKLAQIKVSR